MRGQRPLIALFLAAVFLATCSQDTIDSEDLFVVSNNAEELPLEPSNRISANKTIVLGEDQRIVVADTAGQIHEVNGPFEGVMADVIDIPVSTQAGAQVWQALDEFLGAGQLPQSRTRGATRNLGDDEIWNLYISETEEKSTHCIPESTYFLVTRPSSQVDRDAVLSFTDSNGRSSSFVFDYSQTSVRISSGSLSPSVYNVTLEDREILTVELKLIRDVRPTMLGVSLIDVGCNSQFETLVASVR